MARVAAESTGEDVKVVLVRNETSPEDVHGMHAAQAILTAKGGMTSHAALLQAADRGVRVRLLLDDLTTRGGLDSTLAALGAHPNVEVRLFNPFRQRSFRSLGFLTDFSRLNRRMHNKSLTVDGVATIIGGRNIADEYFQAGDGFGYIDLDVLAGAERPQPHPGVDGGRGRRSQVDRVVELHDADPAEHPHVDHPGERTGGRQTGLQRGLDPAHLATPVPVEQQPHGRPGDGGGQRVGHERRPVHEHARLAVAVGRGVSA
jgi:hypothetical protein